VSFSFFFGAGCGLVGLVLVYWAAPLSIRYNAWTTGLREHHPGLEAPPSLEWQARNTKIMTVIFRTAGMFFVLLSFLTLISSFAVPH
jgi:hypothetical protein